MLISLLLTKPSFYKFNQTNKLVLQLGIDNYLKDELIKNHIHEIKKFQYDAMMSSLGGQHVFVNSCTGSGKTLAYLLPIMSRILNQKSHGSNINKKVPHGAVIFTLNKQLCLQIYHNIRKLDPKSLLKVHRTGPISHYSPVINQLSTPTKTPQDQHLIDAKINQNINNILKWQNNDIIISTPQMLNNIIHMRKNQQQFIPQFIVIDEADILMQTDVNIRRHLWSLIKQIKKNCKDKGKKRLPQFLITASSNPKKLLDKTWNQSIEQIFPNIHIIDGISKHIIPQSISLFSIDINININTSKSKQYYLEDIIKKRINQRILIFCNNKKTIDQLSIILKHNIDVQYQLYHAGLDSNQRSRVLYRFSNGFCTILISTDLGARGLDFNLPINLIIEYQMCQNTVIYINRVGRTGRNNIPGQVITFVQQKDQQLFKHIQQLLNSNNQLDDAFSRKRSYSKLYKQT